MTYNEWGVPEVYTVVALYHEVKSDCFIPKRFRKLSKKEWAREKPKYLAYLKKVIENRE